MIRNVVAVERDGFDVRTLTVSFEVPDESFDILAAIERAVEDYVKTEEGKKTYEYTGGYFNLADFDMNVPNEICENHGFKKVDSLMQDIEIDWDHDFSCGIEEDEEDEE